MRVSEIAVLERYAHHFKPQIPKFKEGRYTQIIVLRETKSHTIFTTEGQSLHVERTPAGIENFTPIERVIMYKRKQIAPERRTGKALLRQFDLCPSQDIKDRNGKVIVPKGECQIIGQACGICPDCIIYGFVITSSGRAGSQRARVLTDSGFVVRGLPQVTRNIKLNAITETTSGGIAAGAYSHRENLMPEVFLPTVETLVDVTKEEFVYVIGNILRTTRYGAESGHEGFVRNHIVGAYFSDVEVFSNLEMSQLFYDILNTNGSIPDTLSLQDFTGNFAPMANECIKKAVGRITMMTNEELSELIHDISVIYSDQQYLAEFLRGLNEMSMTYAARAQAHGQRHAQDANGQQHTLMAM
jgi:CRISPR-associated protein Csc2